MEFWIQQNIISLWKWQFSHNIKIFHTLGKRTTFIVRKNILVIFIWKGLKQCLNKWVYCMYKPSNTIIVQDKVSGSFAPLLSIWGIMKNMSKYLRELYRSNSGCVQVRNLTVEKSVETVWNRTIFIRLYYGFFLSLELP